MNCLVVITARGGSKGVRNKNIKPLCGKPLIAYTIEAARKSKFYRHFDILLSTDDSKIAAVAKRYGCPVPFLRPKKLATDTASSEAAVLHALKTAEVLNGKKYDYVILLQPTSPLRNEKHLDKAIGLIRRKRCDSVLSVTEPDAYPAILKKMERGGYLRDFSRVNGPARRQDTTELYALNGAIYICRRDVFVKRKKLSGPRAAAFVMDKLSSVDIDTMEDFRLAEMIMKDKKRKRKKG